MSGPTDRRRIVLVTGLSGAGKTSILHTLEDLGFRAIDNLPLEFLATVVAREQGKLAIGVDARAQDFSAAGLLGAIAALRADARLDSELIFAAASEETLQRRYTATRRRHPLAPQGRVIEGIRAEAALLDGLRDGADLTLDTSELPPAALRQAIETRFGAPSAASLTLTLVSFAFPAGLPRDADLVFDVRFLRNPHYVAALAPLTGLDPDVAAFIRGDPDYTAFLIKVGDLMQLLLPRYAQEGKRYVTIGIGCTGGRHRSVCVAESLAVSLSGGGWRPMRIHRELGRGAAPSDPAALVPISALSPLQSSHAPLPAAAVAAGSGAAREV